MKSIKIGLIAVLSVLAVSLFVILVYGMMGGNIYRGISHQCDSVVRLVLEEEIPIDGIDTISILYGMNSNDVYLFESENEAVTIREYSCSEMQEGDFSSIEVKENSLEVKGARRSYSSGGFHLFYFGSAYGRHYTEVYLPASYQGEILLETSGGNIVSDFDIRLEEDLSVASTSGDVNFCSVTAQNVSVNTSSGYVNMENIDTSVNGIAGEINIKTSSGDVDLQELTGQTKIESSSGYLTIRAITGDAQLRTSSGDMEIRELTGKATMESSSGNVTIETLTGSAQLKTTSGDVNIQYMNGDIQTATNSGSVKIFEGNGSRALSTSSGDVVVEGAESDFRINTQSGDVQVFVQNGGGSIETTSGEVQLGLEMLAGALNISSSSGCVNIKLSVENEFEFLADTSSGDIMTFFDEDLKYSSRGNRAQGTYGGNVQGNRVEIQTTSGDVRILKY